MKVSNYFCRPIPGRGPVPWSRVLAAVRLSRRAASVAVGSVVWACGGGWRRGSGPPRGAVEAALARPFWTVNAGRRPRTCR